MALAFVLALSALCQLCYCLDMKRVGAKAGDDVVLPCTSDTQLDLAYWTNPTGIYVFSRDRLSHDYYQDPGFHGRVQLKEWTLKNDASIILKNVTAMDAGVYKCAMGWVLVRGWITQQVILEVMAITEPGQYLLTTIFIINLRHTLNFLSISVETTPFSRLSALNFMSSDGFSTQTSDPAVVNQNACIPIVS
uniref:Ig-like domain-containing protein n=1 Tax=Monopterus albus TaxID=43700 RepID=A0A3Q3JAJ4_MONAL